MTAEGSAGAPLDAAALDDLERWASEADWMRSENVRALVAALRAAWAENERYRAALEEIRDRRPVWGTPDGPFEGADSWVNAVSRLCNVANAALGAPGAREVTTP